MNNCLILSGDKKVSLKGGMHLRIAAKPKMILLPIAYQDAPFYMTRINLLNMAKLVRQYWEEVSYGDIIFDIDAAPTFIAPVNKPTSCEPYDWNTETLDAATAIGRTWTHPVFLVTGMSCPYAGIGNLGSPGAWINTDQPTVGVRVIAHEIGHNLDFGHAHAYYCPGGAFDPAVCTIREYGDPLDIMGSGMCHDSASSKEFKGWIPSIRSIGRPSYSRLVLAPLEGPTGERAISVDRQDGRKAVIEYRQPVGLDEALTIEQVAIRLSDGFNSAVYETSISNGGSFADQSPTGGVAVRSNGGGDIEILTFPGSTAAPSFPPPPVIPPVTFITMPPFTPLPEDTMSSTLLLGPGNRFSVDVSWISPSANGNGVPLQMTPITGGFWFFTADNYELIVKVLDGTGINGHWWIFYASLTNVAFTLTIKDAVTGVTRVYNNLQGQMASAADTEAF